MSSDIHAWDHQNIRSCIVASPFPRLSLKGLRPKSLAYPKECKTLGDWIRKIRLDRGLYQEQVGQMLGVCENSVTNWELNYAQPEVRYIPRIIEFIGYCPYDTTGDLIDRVRAIRLAFGFNQEKMAKLLQVDECSLCSWEKREHKPVKASIGILLKFLAAPLQYLTAGIAGGK